MSSQPSTTTGNTGLAPPPYPKAPEGGYSNATSGFQPQNDTQAYPPPAPGQPAMYGAPGQAPMGYGMGPAPGVMQTTIVAPAMVQRLGHGASPAVCPSCKQQVTSVVDYTVGAMTWVACVILCLIGLDCGCCLIPFCLDAAKTANHRCPNCQSVIGEHNPF